MLQKKDLVKQFELVVKQEIIEHNKAISANNIAMQKIRDEIALSVKEIRENFNFLKSEISDNKNSILQLFHLIEQCSKKTLEISTDVKIKLAKNTDDLKKDINLLAKEFVSESAFSKYREICIDKFNFLSSTVEDLKEVLKNKLNDVEKRLNLSYELYHKKVTEVPISIEKFKKELIKKISEQKVDKDGLSREISILKKDCFIKEKQIENLYTLIERIDTKIDKMNTLAT